MFGYLLKGFSYWRKKLSDGSANSNVLQWPVLIRRKDAQQWYQQIVF